MNPQISESTLILAAIFLAVTVCFLSAMAFGVPFLINQINQLFINADIDFEMPLPTQFQK